MNNNNNSELTHKEVHSPLRCALEMERCVLDIKSKKLDGDIQLIAYDIQILIEVLISKLEAVE